MILLQILDHDLHRARDGEKIVFFVENPSRSEWLPAIISNTRGKFVSTGKLYSIGEFKYRIEHPGKSFPKTNDKRKYISSGVFDFDPDRIDDVIPDLFDAAYDLSLKSEWSNIFSGKKAAEQAFDYIKKNGLPGFPHVCLVPQSWSATVRSKFFGAKNVNGIKYRKFCRVIPCKVNIPVFLSRPDMVGMYTQFLGGHSSIFLHNVKLGISFCAPEGGS